MEILIAIIVFAVCMAAMGVGMLYKGRCLRGSCGGEPVRVGGETISCASCPKRKENSESCAAPTEQST